MTMPLADSVPPDGAALLAAAAEPPADGITDVVPDRLGRRIEAHRVRLMSAVDLRGSAGLRRAQVLLRTAEQRRNESLVESERIKELRADRAAARRVEYQAELEELLKATEGGIDELWALIEGQAAVCTAERLLADAAIDAVTDLAATQAARLTALSSLAATWNPLQVPGWVTGLVARANTTGGELDLLALSVARSAAMRASPGSRERLVQLVHEVVAPVLLERRQVLRQIADALVRAETAIDEARWAPWQPIKILARANRAALFGPAPEKKRATEKGSQ